MAEPNAGGKAEFASFLKGTHSVEDLTSGKVTVLRGSIFRSTDTTFALATGDGQLFEIESAAVERYKVVGSGLHPEVELALSSDALRNAKAIAFKQAAADSAQKSLINEKATFKDLRTDPIVDHTLFSLDHKLPFKDIRKDPISDPIGTLFRDPPGGTDFEPGFDPNQWANPAGGLTPFVLATPHQAPEAAVNMQAGFAQARQGFKPLPSDTGKEAVFDTLKEPISDTHKEVVYDTLKELSHDTLKEMIKDPLQDTRKELIETIGPEGGFQGPGGFPGMPNF